jgi:alcohol dehydrogenase YqhD (iron-dependent ADH family)
MNTVTLLQPPRIVFGNGCAPHCAEFLASRGVKRVLLVSSTPVMPTLGAVTAALQKSGIEMILATPVDAEPTRVLFETALKFARAEKIDGVLGIGGQTGGRAGARRANRVGNFWHQSFGRPRASARLFANDRRHRCGSFAECHFAGRNR